MGRRRGRAALLALISGTVGSVLVGLAPTASAASPPPVSTAATAYQIDPVHDGLQVDPSFAAPLRKAWSHDLGGTVFYPLIVGNRVYVDAAQDGSSGTFVYAFDATTGKQVWGPVALGGLYSFGAITYDAGRLFALNVDGLLSAFNSATGARLWSAQMPGQSFFTAPPTARNGSCTWVAPAAAAPSMQWTRTPGR